MKYELIKRHKVAYSECGTDGRLNLFSISLLAQNNMTEYWKKIGSDNLVLKEKYNAAWIISKSKNKVIEFPIWNQDIVIRTNIVKKKIASVIVETIGEDTKGNILFIDKKESCVIDLTSRSIRKISTVSFPEDFEPGESIFEDKFTILNEEFNENDFVYEEKARALDIDFTKHVNNSMYVKYLLNSFENSYWDNKKIEEFELHFMSESTENTSLKMYKKEKDDNSVKMLIKNDSGECVRSLIKYRM